MDDVDQCNSCDVTTIDKANEISCFSTCNDQSIKTPLTMLMEKTDDAGEDDDDDDEDDDNDHVFDSEEEPVDPRIEEKLEELNQWTVRINNLEKEFDGANGQFSTFLTDYSDKLKLMARKIGPKSVNEARLYYEAKDRARSAQAKCQITVAAYEKACQMLMHAKKEIEATEKKFNSSKCVSQDNVNCTHKHNAHLSPVNLVVDCVRESPDFDVTWQEMLNQSTQKLMKAENLKNQSRENHEKSMKDYIAAENEVSRLEKKMKSTLKKTKEYFQESHKFKDHLVKIKAEITIISEKIRASKSCYSLTLKDLEVISEEIHEKRNLKLVKSLKKREPGVGAEVEDKFGSSVEEARYASPSSNMSNFDYSSIDIVPELNVDSPRFHIRIRPSSLTISNASTDSSSNAGEDDVNHSLCQVNGMKIVSDSSNVNTDGMKIFEQAQDSSFNSSSFSLSSANSSFSLPRDSLPLSGADASSQSTLDSSHTVSSSTDTTFNSDFTSILNLSLEQEKSSSSPSSKCHRDETFDDVDLNA